MGREGRQANTNYSSGEDYFLEFRSFRYGFNAIDFQQRVEMAAVELEFVQLGVLDEEGLADLVRLVARGELGSPVSSFGDYVVERGEEVLRHNGECLVYWLRELVFRGAWMDLRLMEDQLGVAFNGELGTFVYHPKRNRSREIGPPPHPSWRQVAFAL